MLWVAVSSNEISCSRSRPLFLRKCALRIVLRMCLLHCWINMVVLNVRAKTPKPEPSPIATAEQVIIWLWVQSYNLVIFLFIKKCKEMRYSENLIYITYQKQGCDVYWECIAFLQDRKMCLEGSWCNCSFLPGYGMFHYISRVSSNTR